MYNDQCACAIMWVWLSVNHQRLTMSKQSTCNNMITASSYSVHRIQGMSVDNNN